MIEIKNKKIAIIGTSPIMILLYFRLQKSNSIDVFENSNIGGAWRVDEINEQYYTTHNNVIVAMNKYEEKYIDMINKELESLGCIKTLPTGEYETSMDYCPKNKYIHDLSGFYRRFKEICNSLVRSKVNKIEAFGQKVFLNNVEYDQVYIPCCFDIKEIVIDKVNINTFSSKSISHHLTVVYDQVEVPDISYTENFDNVFDRAYFKQEGTNILFTGRVRREYKNLTSNELVGASNLLKNTTDKITNFRLNKYHHSIVDDSILRNLKSKLDEKNINIIETRQFVHSFKILSSLFR